MSRNIKAAVLGMMAFAPFIAGAQVSGNPSNILGFMVTLQKVFNAIVPIMVALALIYFIYGLAEYILESGDTGKKEEGRARMIYGTIAMFVIASVWGLVYFLQDTLGIQRVQVLPAPGVVQSVQ
ncbi:MAG: hypothetical protein WC764_00795 [Candidatus Paceibacterota bacterium]|jgi:hypothetical protein